MRRYLFHRLAGRIVRRVIGIQREPVRQLTEADYRAVDHMFAALSASLAAIAVAIVLRLLH
jgi:hypothetical protein